VSYFWINNERLPVKYLSLQRSAIYNSWVTCSSWALPPVLRQWTRPYYVYTYHVVLTLCSVTVEGRLVSFVSCSRENMPVSWQRTNTQSPRLRVRILWRDCADVGFPTFATQAERCAATNLSGCEPRMFHKYQGSREPGISFSTVSD
jgi:hypothetical protein